MALGAARQSFDRRSTQSFDRAGKLLRELGFDRHHDGRCFEAVVRIVRVVARPLALQEMLHERAVARDEPGNELGAMPSIAPTTTHR